MKQYQDIVIGLYRREEHLSKEYDRIERERGSGEYLAYVRGVLSELQFVLDTLDPDMEFCDLGD